MKRLSLLFTAAFAAIAVAVALAATGSAQQPGEQTVKLVERPLTGHVVDNPPKAPKGTRRTAPLFSPGDLTVQTSALYDESNTTRLGTLHSECIATRGGTRARATFHCNGTFQLKEGTLAIDFAGKSAETVTSAVTGGTGAFEGRDGSDLSRENRDVVEHTIRLRP